MLKYGDEGGHAQLSLRTWIGSKQMGLVDVHEGDKMKKWIMRGNGKWVFLKNEGSKGDE